ncbi:MAG: SPOR domain-containing protein, partial [Betaproteobacteria bacterium AqS2]|nr:SPOR domain-containing protein [Betaproteobacteria bacterium AqS2]
MVRDHVSRRRRGRVRWWFTVWFSFTAGVVTAATFFAYTARIPIPLKITPTRGADNILSSQPQRIEDRIEFQDRLETRVLDSPVEIQTQEGVVRAPALPAAEEQAPAEQSTEEPAAEEEKEPVKLAYFVQAGSFTEPGSAAQLAQELGALGLNAAVRSFESGSGSLHRVLVGPYDSSNDAEG